LPSGETRNGGNKDTDTRIFISYGLFRLFNWGAGVLVMHEIAIFGGSGFIGSSLAGYLSDSFKVKVLDRHPVPDHIRGTVDFEFCDIGNYDDVKKGVRDVQLVIHTAIVQIPLINEMKRLGYEVNMLGTQNLCEAVDKVESVRGLLLAGSWHVFGEREFRGIVDEAFGFRPDKIEDRARLYALCKIGQETVVRIYDEMSSKLYGTIRLGTVLGEAMPEKTAANIFISKGLRGEPITPYRHSMHRPMLYVDVCDVCRAFEAYSKKVLDNKLGKREGSFAHIVNLVWPKPITVIELANIVRDKIVNCSLGKILPEIKVIDAGHRVVYTSDDKKTIRVDTGKAKDFLGMSELNSPEQAIDRIVKARMCKSADAKA